MKNFITIILATVLLSSCVVSRKEYEKLNSEKYSISKNLHNKNKELITTKHQHRNSTDSIITVNNKIIEELNSKIDILNSEIGLLNDEVNEKQLSQSGIAEELSKKDSLNTVYLGKLKWIRLQNKKLTDQLAVANEEKQIANELLVACNKQKNQSLANSNASGNSSIINFKNKSYSVFSTSAIDKVKMGLKNKNGDSFRSIENLISETDSEIIYASNGGMYLKDHNPQGLYIENGKLITEMDEKQEGYGNFYMQPNGVFMLTKDSAQIVKSVELKNKGYDNIMFATQSGPMLIINGKINSKFSKNSKHLNIRNGVGVNDKNEVILIKSETPVTFYEMASIFKEKYNCKNALYLDGVISRTHLPEIDKKDLGGDFGVMIYVTK